MRPGLFILSFVFLAAMEWIYILTARKFGIVDRPNERTLHEWPTVRGGGIVFYFGFIIAVILVGGMSLWLVAGVTLVFITGFLDDIYDMPSVARLLVQIVAFGFMFWDIGFLSTGNPWVWLGWVVAVGAINAFNFMDGINGLTAGYSLVTLLTLLWIDATVIDFVDANLPGIMISSLVVFSFFNFRSRALAFAGDVGSTTIAFIILYLIFILIYKTGNAIYIMFLTLYGVDTFLTIIHRIMRQENILKAHRLHLFQVMVLHFKIPHTRMSMTYMAIQFIVNVLIIMNLTQDHVRQYTFGALILFVLGLAYVMIKLRIFKTFQKAN
ncbi:MAG TPA: hypothetical protein PLR06_07270 [Cyclobacteriaceae bacterium]|nr:hypothetical protein [Cyclobacteriaceae bacterium]